MHAYKQTNKEEGKLVIQVWVEQDTVVRWQAWGREATILNARTKQQCFL